MNLDSQLPGLRLNGFSSSFSVSACKQLAEQICELESRSNAQRAMVRKLKEPGEVFSSLPGEEAQRNQFWNEQEAFRRAVDHEYLSQEKALQQKYALPTPNLAKPDTAAPSTPPSPDAEASPPEPSLEQPPTATTHNEDVPPTSPQL